MTQVTLADIAAKAQVSTATVSRVLSGSLSVADETKRRVLDAAEELRYFPTKRAYRPTSLRYGRVGLFVVLNTDDLQSDWYIVRLIQGIESLLQERRLSLAVFTSHASEATAKLPDPQEMQIDGLIAVGSLDAPHLMEELRQLKAPLVLIDRYLDRQTPSVVVDSITSTKEVVQYFHGLGHRSIAAIVGPQRVPSSRDKVEGYRLGLHLSKLEYDPDLVMHVEKYHTWQGGYEAASSLFAREEKPTAIFVGDDLMASGVIKAAEDAGLSVPEDCALIGFGDLLYQKTGIPLTSVSIDFSYIGELAAKLLVDHADGKLSQNLQIALRPPLVIRKTCGGGKS